MENANHLVWLRHRPPQRTGAATILCATQCPASHLLLRLSPPSPKMCHALFFAHYAVSLPRVTSSRSGRDTHTPRRGKCSTVQMLSPERGWAWSRVLLGLQRAICVCGSADALPLRSLESCGDSSPSTSRAPDALRVSSSLCGIWGACARATASWPFRAASLPAGNARRGCVRAAPALPLSAAETAGLRRAYSTTGNEAEQVLVASDAIGMGQT